MMNDAIKLSCTYSIFRDVTYVRAGGMDLHLDIYAPAKNFDRISGEIKSSAKKRPTVVFIHGGGWVYSTREESSFQVLPYLNRGWCAVNVEYRLGSDARAPAAVEDVRSAVWWVKRNCAKYGFDPDCIVLTGLSAGAHLALMAGILPSSAGFDTRSPHIINPDDPSLCCNASLPELEVAAIINWAGVTDVCDLIKEPNIRSFALQWMGGQEGANLLAQRVSPLNYVRKGLPPILTLHGDKDVVVPYDHAKRLHAELDRFGVKNHLHTIEGKEHFDFSLDDIGEAYDVIDSFLDECIFRG